MSDIYATIYTGSKTVTASDTDPDPAGPFASILVTSAGNVSLILLDQSEIDLTAVPANTVLPFACVGVKSTGLTATVKGLLAPRFEGGRGT